MAVWICYHGKTRRWCSTCCMCRPSEPWMEEINRKADKGDSIWARLLAHWRDKAEISRYADQVQQQVMRKMHGDTEKGETRFNSNQRPGSPAYIELQPTKPRRPIIRRNNARRPKPPLRTMSHPMLDESASDPEAEQEFNPPPMRTITAPPRLPAHAMAYPDLPPADPTRTTTQQVLYEANKVDREINRQLNYLRNECIQLDNAMEDMRKRQAKQNNQDPPPPGPYLSSTLPIWYRRQPDGTYTQNGIAPRLPTSLATEEWTPRGWRRVTLPNETTATTSLSTAGSQWRPMPEQNIRFADDIPLPTTTTTESSASSTTTETSSTTSPSDSVNASQPTILALQQQLQQQSRREE